MKTTKQMIEVMQGFCEGKELESRRRNTNDDWRGGVKYPDWNWVQYDFRIKEEDEFVWAWSFGINGWVYTNDRTRKMTYRELSKWLAQGNGEALKQGDVLTTTMIHYCEDGKTSQADEPSEQFLIRSWDETEWHEPYVEEV